MKPGDTRKLINAEGTSSGARTAAVPLLGEPHLLRQTITKLILSLALISASGALRAGPAFFNTGVDGNGQQLSGGSPDPHYLMRQVTTGAYVGNASWSNAVAMDSAITWSSWIRPADARWIYVANAANLGQDWGTYEFQTTFDLTGYDPSTAVLAGKWALDQYGSIYLNGNLVASLPDGNWNNNLTSFSLTSGFVPGTNVLTFDVRFPDGGDGMIVSGATLTATPVLPTLTISYSAPQYAVAWLASAANYLLESATNLLPADWVTNTSIITSNGTNYFFGTNPVGTMFFRLKR